VAGYFLIMGEPDLAGFIVILLIALASVGGFVFVVVFICVKVFGRRGAEIMTINPGRDGEGRL
jgi:hypothetical protein